jgi:hypothetical protein
MKAILIILVLGLGMMGLIGCATVPRHYTYVEEVIYYPPPPPPPPEYYYPPVPPTPPIVKPPVSEPNPPRNRQPEKPKDSYNQRDPLRGGSNRGNDILKTNPPFRTPVKKDRSQR